MPGDRSIPQTMEAVFLEDSDGSLVVRETEIPHPGPGEVLVKISAAPVNPSDLGRIKNALENNEMGVFIPGLEGSGKVVEAGKGILPHVWLGKRVACSSSKSSSGTWAQYMVTDAGLCFPLGKKVSDEQGSMSLVNPLTALAFFEIAKKDKRKAIINNAAASALGRMVDILGKKYRIPVINIVRQNLHVDMLKNAGSEFVLNSSHDSFIADLQTLVNKLNATLLFEPVCSRQLSEIIDILPHNSKVIVYGKLSEEETVINPVSLIYHKIKISGFYLGDHAKEKGLLKNMLSLMEVQRLMSNDITVKVRKKYSLKEVQEAIDSYLENMSSGKVILIP